MMRVGRWSVRSAAETGSLRATMARRCCASSATGPGKCRWSRVDRRGTRSCQMTTAEHMPGPRCVWLRLRERDGLSSFPHQGVLHVPCGVLEVAHGLLTFALQLVHIPLTLHLLVVGEVAYALLHLPLALVEHAFAAITGAAVGYGENLLLVEQGQTRSCPALGSAQAVPSSFRLDRVVF